MSNKIETMDKKFKQMEEKDYKKAQDMENQPLDSTLHMMPNMG